MDSNLTVIDAVDTTYTPFDELLSLPTDFQTDALVDAGEMVTDLENWIDCVSAE